MPEDIIKIDVPVLTENPAINRQKIAQKRREEIEHLIKRKGISNTRDRIHVLAEHYKVNERRIYEDIDKIKGRLKPEDLRESTIELRIGRKNALKRAMETFDEVPTLDNAKKFMDILVDYRQEMEKWGIKEQVAEKKDFSMKIGNMYEIIEDTETKDGAGKIEQSTTESKPEADRDTASTG
jgi:hypothetical protein